MGCVVERGGKGARLGRRPLQEVEGHQEFVEVETVVFEGVFFEGVLLEAEGFIEADGGEIGADDGEEDLFDFGAGGVNGRLARGGERRRCVDGRGGRTWRGASLCGSLCGRG